MDDERTLRTARLLSLALRHQPEVLGLALDGAGGVRVDDVLRGLQVHGVACSREELEELVASNLKRRFALSADGVRIRANQGHAGRTSIVYERLDARSRGAPGRVRVGLRPSKWRASRAMLSNAPTTGGHSSACASLPSRNELVRKGLAHVGVAVLGEIPSDLEHYVLVEAKQVAIVPRAHVLAKRKTLRLTDLEGQSLIVPPESGPQRATLLAALAENGVSVDVVATTRGWDAVLTLVALGVGIGS